MIGWDKHILIIGTTGVFRWKNNASPETELAVLQNSNLDSVCAACVYGPDGDFSIFGKSSDFEFEPSVNSDLDSEAY